MSNAGLKATEYIPGAWSGPATNRPRTPMTGEQFSVAREKGAAERAGVKDDGTQLPPVQQLSFELACAAIPRPAAWVIAREIINLVETCERLQGQVDVLRQQLAAVGQPIHLAKTERRG